MEPGKAPLVPRLLVFGIFEGSAVPGWLMVAAWWQTAAAPCAMLGVCSLEGSPGVSGDCGWTWLTTGCKTAVLDVANALQAEPLVNGIRGKGQGAAQERFSE